MRGKITQWKDDKGFGFIVSEDGADRLFFHISSVKNRGRRPKVDDVVIYESTRDSQGRSKASAVVIEDLLSEQTTYRGKRIHTKPPKKDALDYVSIVLVVLSVVGAAYFFIPSGDIEKTLPFGVVLVVAVVLLNRQKKPKEKRFTCARCRNNSAHDKRTIRAWNRGFIKLYCAACHQRWLAQQPKQSHYDSASSRGGGCLGVFALLVILPIIAGVGVYRWFV